MSIFLAFAIRSFDWIVIVGLFLLLFGAIFYLLRSWWGGQNKSDVRPSKDESHKLPG